jgi:uncharacterized protein YbjT (DUF2867 family)
MESVHPQGKDFAMFLVTGATGHVGGELVGQLTARGLPVRAMTRRPEAARFPAGVEVVYGDCDDPGSLAAAFDGVSRAFVMSAQAVGSAPEPTHEPRLVRAAQQAGVRHLVKLSVYSGGNGDDPIAGWNRAAEAAVIDSGLAWTMLRPGRFMSNALQWRSMIHHGDTVHIPFAHRPAASIDPADIAAVAVAALTTDDHYDAGYQMSGPQALTPAEELRILAETLGRPLRLVEPSIEATRAGMLGYGVPEPVVDAILERTLDDEEGTDVLPTVSTILGRPPATFAQWATAHAAQFNGSVDRRAGGT